MIYLQCVNYNFYFTLIFFFRYIIRALLSILSFTQSFFILPIIPTFLPFILYILNIFSLSAILLILPLLHTFNISCPFYPVPPGYPQINQINRQETRYTQSFQDLDETLRTVGVELKDRESLFYDDCAKLLWASAAWLL